MPLVRRTRATFRSAEFGFFGVCVKTRTQTPRFWGLSCSAGLFVFVTILWRPCRTSCVIVGTVAPHTAPGSHAAPDVQLRACEPEHDASAAGEPGCPRRCPRPRSTRLAPEADDPMC